MLSAHRNLSDPRELTAAIVTTALRGAVCTTYHLYLLQVMKALIDVGFDGCAIPDHIPDFAKAGAGLAYSVAYMRALVQASHSIPTMIGAGLARL